MNKLQLISIAVIAGFTVFAIGLNIGYFMGLRTGKKEAHGVPRMKNPPPPPPAKMRSNSTDPNG